MDRSARRQTCTLTERVGVECRLTPADVDFLMAGHRAHVNLAPTGRRGRYRLTPTGHVGTIVGPDCRLVIRPKIPLDNLFHLLDPTGPIPVTEDHSATETGAGILDFLAGRLARLLGERAGAGLHHSYTERTGCGPFLQGRLDLAAHLRDPNGRRDRLHCRYEDFTVDVPCNQVPRATVELLLRCPLLGDGVRAALHRSLAAFAEVSTVALSPDSFAAAAPDRLTEAYRPLLDLCRLLAGSLTPGEAAGPAPCPAFLLDMERVFEDYCVGSCLRQLPTRHGSKGGYDVSVQPLFRIGDLSMRPDLVVNRAAVPVLVLDAKWKKDAVLQDVYQVLAYCAVLGVRQAVLVYPGRRDGKRDYHFERTGVTVTVRKLRVVGAREQCQRSARRLGRKIFSVGRSRG